jgi:hypothetical protein
VTARLCGTEWCTGDLHREPEPDWIGDMPIIHGESEIPVPGTGGWNGLYTESPDHYCLCGHPNYLTCWEYATGGGIQSMTIERAGEES